MHLLDPDYEKSFDYRTPGHCIMHLDKWGGLKFPSYSPTFKDAICKNYKLYNGRDFIYPGHLSVCKIDKLPSRFYVQFCWVCQNNYYAVPSSPRCNDCKGL